MRSLLLPTLLLLVLSACTLTADEPTPPTDLAAAKARWHATGIDSYEVVFQWQCYCTYEYVAPVRLVVDGGVLVGGRYEADGRVLNEDDLARYRTVEGLFAFIEDAISRHAHVIRTEFDPETGFPAAVWVDYSEGIADEEMGFRISSLEPR